MFFKLDSNKLKYKILLIPIKYKDKRNLESNLNFDFNIPEFVKHFGFAGMGNYPSYLNLIKGIGALMYFSNFVNYSGLKIKNFREVHSKIYDPTEKGQFSNLIGKALADFASKKISKSKLSINYEAVMKTAGIPIKGNRPDLYCTDAKREQFAIECKGFTKSFVSDQEMEKHKKQSKSGPLKVNYSFASVSYCLYWNLKVKYYDPVNVQFPYNEDLNYSILEKYYEGILDIRNKLESNNSISFQGKTFDVIFLSEIFDRKIHLLISKNIEQFIYDRAIEDDYSNFDLENNYYIDLDGIGIYVENK